MTRGGSPPAAPGPQWVMRVIRHRSLASWSPRGGLAWAGAVLLLGLHLGANRPPLAAQIPPDLARDRAAYSQWLMTASLSPFSARAVQPIGAGLSLGAEPADMPLSGVPRGTLTEEHGTVALVRGSVRRTIPRNRPIELGAGHRLVIAGPAGRTIVAAYGPVRSPKAPDYFDHRPGLAFTVVLLPPERKGRFPILGPDGVETEAAEAGFAAVPVAGDTVRLRVYQVGAADDEETELLIFFRDASNGHGSYPAGRFVELLPLSGGRYRLDFNRARNPFCAYNSVFPCPAPWPGNHLAASIAAGERYSGGGLELE